MKTARKEEPKEKDPNSGIAKEHGSVTATNRSYFLQENEKLRSVTYRQTKYCIQVRQNKNYVQVPLNPQPQAETVLVLSRYYAKYKSGAGYEKRISFLHSEKFPALAFDDLRAVAQK
ncbi:hypothetical protein PoB_005323000 [Plakobranchus ocellatus]|uniref:Uncharacterized protein n=1 Tax=Plakobranchus ocellatus TaxID=259542 RepID=A0AAV4C229_9GAST|nr:hypothetical protein PoB_005323000 [Plakobranchus ocellatus]